jgi:hypothetical protein
MDITVHKRLEGDASSLATTPRSARHRGNCNIQKVRFLYDFSNIINARQTDDGRIHISL